MISARLEKVIVATPKQLVEKALSQLLNWSQQNNMNCNTCKRISV